MPQQSFFGRHPLLAIGCGLSVISILSCTLCCGLGAVINVQKTQQATTELVEADRMWESGQRADAVSKYQGVLNAGLASVPSPSERPKVYQRLIDFEVERGNLSAAQTLVEKALDKNVSLSSDNKATNQLVAQVRGDREKRDQEQRAKREEEAKRREEERRDREAKREEERQKREADAARRSEEEIESNGLALVKNTVRGEIDDIGMKITGTVINRRSRTLTYAQITFNLYDRSGAQVGTALGNINGLEAGGRWNFEAYGVGRNAHSYKFSKLSGF